MTPRIGTYREQSRGRPRGNCTLYSEYLRSIVLIASKHTLDPERLVDAFFEALENGISNCGSLKISRREVNQDSVTFLITRGEKVVWQFPVNLENIKNPELMKKNIQDIPIPHYKKREIYPKKQEIGDLRFGMKGIDVKARIIEIPQAKYVFTSWGAGSSVSNVMIADDTGSMRLSLWNDQIHTVHVGDDIEIKNCKVSRFASELQLRLGRKGTISVINQSQRSPFR